MTNVQALKSLYEQLGGSAEAVENISTTPEMIHTLNEVAGGGGAGKFVVNLDLTTNKVDKTFAEIVEALGAGKIVEMHSERPGVANTSVAGVLPYSYSVKLQGGTIGVAFGTVNMLESSGGTATMVYIAVAVNPDESVEIGQYTFTATKETL